jgi:hypothetical protein
MNTMTRSMILSVGLFAVSIGLAFGFASIGQPTTSSGSSRRSVLRSASTSTSDESIIPREILFGNPKYASPKLSPDGKFLNRLAPSEQGVLNVFVKQTTDPPMEDSKRLTNDTSRGIRNAFWAPDSQTILYLQNFEEDESSSARDLTPGDTKYWSGPINEPPRHLTCIAVNIKLVP